eukprot:gene8238-14177_t
MAFVTNILIRSNKGSANIPFNVSLGTIRSFSKADSVVYEDTVDYTAKQMSDHWYSQVLANVHNPPLGVDPLVSLPTHVKSTGLDSSALSEFLETNTVEHFPAAREVLARNGRLRGLVKSCPYLQLEGGLHGGTYVISLNQEVFSRICR